MCKRRKINPLQIKAEYLHLSGLAKGQEYLKMSISLKTMASLIKVNHLSSQLTPTYTPKQNKQISTTK